MGAGMAVRLIRLFASRSECEARRVEDRAPFCSAPIVCQTNVAGGRRGGPSTFLRPLACGTIGLALAGLLVATADQAAEGDPTTSPSAIATEQPAFSPTEAQSDAGALKDLPQSLTWQSDVEAQRQPWALALGVASALGLAIGLGALAFSSPIASWRRKRAARSTLSRVMSPADPSAAKPLRNLPVNPFAPDGSSLSLTQQIEAAAAASVEYERTLGLIYFKIPTPRRNSAERSVVAYNSDLHALVGTLRASLRKTDHVTVINPGELIVCLSLLPGLTELKSIARRLQQAASAHKRFSAAFETPPGLAIYPMCGYRGEELIAFARRNANDRARAGEAADALELKPPTPARPRVRAGFIDYAKTQAIPAEAAPQGGG